MEEEWKSLDFLGYKNYEVSNLGRVKSLIGNNKILKPRTLGGYSKGYLRMGLVADHESKYFLIHRLVALAFIPNDDIENKIEINHKDKNRSNNSVENLEWCSKKYNMEYRSKDIYQYNLNGELVAKWNNIKECIQKGYLEKHVRECCQFKKKKYKNFIWSYTPLIITFGFGEALKQLKNGLKVDRKDWVKDSIFIRYKKSKKIFVISNSIDKSTYKWLPNEIELLAEDWTTIK